MSQPTRKRQHQQSPAPPPVKEEQQEQEEGTHSIGAAISASGQCSSSSNFGDNNTIGPAVAGGNGGDDIDMNQLKLKMAAVEVYFKIYYEK
jgi:hypothetical protein